VRIVGGAWRSRVLRFPSVDDLRPTPDRLRETLFNWLGQDLTGQTCLDLFAGSGALGFEAASRGAKSVVMIERNAQAERALRENCSLLAGEGIEIQRADALTFLRADTRHFDVIFLDPPFQADLLPGVLPLLPGHIEPGARVYLEADHLPNLSPEWQRLKHTRVGSVQALLIEWRPT
jgi:16S rRNA (guanine966-N2)-methyltransferase